LEIAEGTKATYRVQEQFIGINFPSDAVGESQTVAGTIVINPDGSVNSGISKLTLDMRSFKSDQDQRDNYVKNRTFESEKFPMAEFVPRRVQGLPVPFPTMGQAGIQLIGDMTIKGVTKEVTWNGIAIFTKEQVSGRVMTNFTFATFGLTKPTIGRLLSVDDKIQLEVVFKMKTSS
jgi:polyisoprenoid-binding protein YceI